MLVQPVAGQRYCNDRIATRRTFAPRATYVYVAGRKVLDGVGGVACSVRGHNPPGYAEEMNALGDVDCEAEVAARLRTLTGLERILSAVSGGERRREVRSSSLSSRSSRAGTCWP